LRVNAIGIAVRDRFGSRIEIEIEMRNQFHWVVNYCLVGIALPKPKREFEIEIMYACTMSHRLIQAKTRSDIVHSNWKSFTDIEENSRFQATHIIKSPLYGVTGSSICRALHSLQSISHSNE
jgi:hypothetical protein